MGIVALPIHDLTVLLPASAIPMVFPLGTVDIMVGESYQMMYRNI
jgi:hypothetical protein